MENYSPFSNFENNYDPTNYDNNLFNPVVQYEQAYMYYKYLTQQLDYKIKCKEYEKFCEKK